MSTNTPEQKFVNINVLNQLARPPKVDFDKNIHRLSIDELFKRFDKYPRKITVRGMLQTIAELRRRCYAERKEVILIQTKED